MDTSNVDTQALKQKVQRLLKDRASTKPEVSALMSLRTIVSGVIIFMGFGTILFIAMPVRAAIQVLGGIASQLTVVGLIWKSVHNRKYRDVRAYYRKYHYDPGDTISPVIVDPDGKTLPGKFVARMEAMQKKKKKSEGTPIKRESESVNVHPCGNGVIMETVLKIPRQAEVIGKPGKEQTLSYLLVLESPELTLKYKIPYAWADAPQKGDGEKDE